MKIILILGSSGLLGSFIYKYLINHNIKVIGSTRHLSKANNDVIFIDPLNQDVNEINNILEKNRISNIVNCSGVKNIHNKHDILTNAYLMNSIYQTDYAKNLQIINIGSMAEYSLHLSNENTIIDENYQECPNNLYGMSKLIGTRIGQSYREFKITTLRVSNVIHPAMPETSIIGALLHSVKFHHNQGLQINNQDNVRDFIDIRDLSELILRIIQKRDFADGIYNVGSGDSYTYTQLLQLFDNICCERELVTPRYNYDNESKPIKFRRYIINKIKKAANWSPTHTLENSIEWCLSENL